MKPPTKFELMRNNRYAADCRAAGVPLTRNVVDAEIARTEPAVGQWTPAVPTMEIDGVKYREAPEIDACDGCAFYEADCFGAIEATARKVFGGPCAHRRVIYVKAEA